MNTTIDVLADPQPTAAVSEGRPWRPRSARPAVAWLLLVALALPTTAVEVTTLADSGAGSLRNACGAKHVVFSPTLAGKTIVLSSRIDLSSDIIIDARAAPGLVISGGGKTRLFFVPMRAKAAFAGLTFADAAHVDLDKKTGINASGGAVYGDMYSEVTIVRCTFRGNRVELTEGGGAAVFMSYHSKLMVSDCRFENNETVGGGERGGAITLATNATSTIQRSHFSGNKGFTGGINNLLSTMTVEDCVFENNEGAHVGGAIYADGASEKTDDDKGGVLTVTRCRFVGNRSPGLGGACYLFMYRHDRLLVDRCVFDGNQGNHGGGFASGNGVMEIVDSVFVRNKATYGAGIWTSGSSVPGNAPLTVRNSLFAYNDAKKGTCGGVSTETTDPLRLERCTFWNNVGGGGSVVQLWKKEAKGVIADCIIADNQAPFWSGPAPTVEGMNVLWPSLEAVPKSEAVACFDPLLEPLPVVAGRMPGILPRAPGLAGRIGAAGAEDAKNGKGRRDRPRPRGRRRRSPRPAPIPSLHRPGASMRSRRSTDPLCRFPTRPVMVTPRRAAPSRPIPCWRAPG